MSKKKHLSNKLWVAILSVVGVVGIVSFAPQEVRALECSVLPQSVCDNTGGSAANPNNSGVMDLLKIILRILTAGVGIVAVAGFVYAAILYSSAGDNSSQVSQAKTYITNTVIGIVAYALMLLAVNFFVPGGVFG